MSKEVSRNTVDISTQETTSKKVRGNNVDFSTIEISSKKVHGSKMDFSTFEITSKKVRGSKVDFSTFEITSKKVHGSKVDFSTFEITSEKYVKTTWIFWPSKLHQKKYVETTWIFRSAKLHGKSTWKWRGNSSEFGLRRINIISTSIRRGFDLECPFGNIYLSKNNKNTLKTMQGLKATSSVRRLFVSLDIHYNNTLILRCRNKMKTKWKNVREKLWTQWLSGFIAIHFFNGCKVFLNLQ